MKKITALLLALLAAGCGSDSLDTHIYFNFEPADVAQAEMFRYAGTADGAEKKTVTAEEDIRRRFQYRHPDVTLQDILSMK